jgi:DNA-binding CsgD family transcriptional regulator
MVSSVLSDNHYSLQITRHVNEILNSVKEEYDIDHCCFSRYFNDNTMINLISNSDLYTHHFKNQYPVAPIIPEEIISKKFHYVVMPNLEDGFSQIAHEYAMYFDLSFPLYLFERNENYFDLYIFGSHGDGARSINTYLNKMPQFEKFKSIFNEKAADLIAESYNHKITIPKSMQPNFSGLKESEHPNSIEASLPQAILKNFSKRKSEVIYYLLRGCTAKEIAKKLNLSPRTIESHIEELKMEIGVNRKSELITEILNRS